MARFVSFLNPSLVDQEGLHKYLTRLFGPGVATAFNANGWKVTQRGAGANMSVDVAVGDGLLARPSGDYGFWGWTTATENVAVTAANPTNPRIDTVVAWVDTSVTTTGSANSSNALKFQIMAGTPAGSPVAMPDVTIQSTLGAAVAWIKLATINVAAGSTSVVNANISDARTGITGLVNSAVADGSITTAKLADSAVTPAKIQFGTGTSWAWQTWTPTLTSWTVGTGGSAGTVARYVQIGKTVHFYIKSTLGTSGFSVGTDISFTFPVTGASWLPGAPVGHVWGIAGGTFYPGQLRPSSTTQTYVEFYADDTGTAGQYVGRTSAANNIPGAWSSNDSFTVTGVYEAA